MRTILKALGIAVAAVAALLAIAALLLWLLFDPNNFRDDLEALVEDGTGREFSIDDDLALTLFPWLGIETGQLRLGHAAGFGDDDFASVDSAVARVRLTPLFGGRMEIGTVVLDGLELNLARDADGRDNWSDLLGSAPAADRAGGPGATPGAIEEPFFGDIDIAGVDIRDGVVFWRENITEVRHVISDISLGTGPIVAGMPVDLDLGLQWVGVDPAFTAQLDGRTSLVVDLEIAGVRADDLRLEFRVDDGQSNERIAGNLQTTATFDNAARTVQVDDLQLEFDLTGFTGSSEPVNVTAIAPSVSVNAATWTADVPEAVTTIGGITARWHMTAESLTEAPLFAGTVTVSASPIEEALALLGVEYDAPMGDFGLVSGFQLEPLAGRATLTGLKSVLLDMAVTGNIAVSDTDISGGLATPTFDSSVFLSVLPPEWLGGANVTAIEQLALSADFTVNRSDNGFTLREFTVSFPGAAISGSVNRPGDSDGINGRIVTSDVDPEVLVAVFPDLLPGALGPERLGTLRADTTFDYDVAGSVLRLENLAASVFGLQTSGDLTVREPAGNTEVTGTLQIASFSPRALLQRFGQDVPPTADPAVLGEAALSADISFDANRAEFASLRMRLDDTNVTGRVEVSGFGYPRYDFDLDMDRINLDRYLPPVSEAPAAPGEEDQAFDTATLGDLNLAGRVSAGELQVSGLSLAGFSTEFDLTEGLGRIEPLEARLYGGEFRGAAELDVRAGGPLVLLQGSLDGVDMEGLLTARSGEPARTSGTGILNVELTGIGDNVDEVLSTATGFIEFDLRDGALHGFNLDHALCDVYNRLGNYPRPAPAATDTTPYSLMRGTAQVRDGIAQTTDLFGNVTTIEISGGGRVDLVTYGIDFDVDAEMTAAIPIPGCETLDGLVGEKIPVVVSGTVTEPQIRPDVEELLKQGLQEEVEEAVLEAVLDLLN